MSRLIITASSSLVREASENLVAEFIQPPSALDHEEVAGESWAAFQWSTPLIGADGGMGANQRPPTMESV